MKSPTVPTHLVSQIIVTRIGKLVASFFFFIIKHSPVWLLPLYVSHLINTVVDSGAFMDLLLPTIIMGVLFILNVPFQALHVRFFSQASREIEKELRTSLIRKLQELSILYYQRNQSGGLSAKFLRDVEAIEMALKQVTMSLLPAVISFIYVFGVTTIRQPIVSLFFLGSLPLMWIVRTVFSGRLKDDNREYRKDMERLSAKVLESIEMLPVARAHAVEETEIDEIETYFQRITRSGLVLDVSNAVFGAWTWVILQLFSLVALVFTGWMAIIGRIPLGDIVLYQSFFGMISNALATVITILPVIYRGKESLNSISEVLDSPDLENYRGRPAFPEVSGSFSFQNLIFRYPETVEVADAAAGGASRSETGGTDAAKGVGFAGGRAGGGGAPGALGKYRETVGQDDSGSHLSALDIQSLHIPVGQSVGIVGPSGSGKTTFVNVIIGFLQPTKGQIFLDDYPYADHDVRSMRKHLSVVGQTPILFSGSIAANISYGDPRGPKSREDEQKIRQALASANALDFVDALPEGIHSLLGEHGANLSGGQRQRLVLARAFYRNPRILIFDEATSALDSHSEQKVQQALETLAKGRTTFIVAHRLSTVMNVDRILVFNKGRIVQDGSPQDLLVQPGLFRELAEVQGIK